LAIAAQKFNQSKFMTLKHQRIISIFLIAIVAFGGLEALIYIVNLNQPGLFLKSSLIIYFYLVLKITLLYDLHFKNPGALKRAHAKHESMGHWLSRAFKIIISALKDRFHYLGKRHHWQNFQNYLILPSILYWSTIALFYIQIGKIKVQHILALIGGAGIVVIYTFLKEAFIRKTEKVERDIFAALTSVKIYTAAIAFGSTMALMRMFCLKPSYYLLAIFSLTFLLIYQALFQHKLWRGKNIAWTAGISAAQATVGYFVYVYWGFNYFTAAIFMAAIYNLMWGTFHYHLDGALTKKVFFEILIISALIAFMVFSVTNFKSTIFGACVF